MPVSLGRAPVSLGRRRVRGRRSPDPGVSGPPRSAARGEWFLLLLLLLLLLLSTASSFSSDWSDPRSRFGLCCNSVPTYTSPTAQQVVHIEKWSRTPPTPSPTSTRIPPIWRRRSGVAARVTSGLRSPLLPPRPTRVHTIPTGSYIRLVFPTERSLP